MNETNWRNFSMTVVVGALVPAAILAPIVQGPLGPQLAQITKINDLGSIFAVLAMNFGFWVIIALSVRLAFSDGGYLRKPRLRFELLADGVELRDGQGAELGATADATLRVTGINIQLGRRMVGAVRLDHRGGSFVVTPRHMVAPRPGMTASGGGAWLPVSNATYEALLRHAA